MAADIKTIKKPKTVVLVQVGLETEISHHSITNSSQWMSKLIARTQSNPTSTTSMRVAADGRCSDVETAWVLIWS